MSLLLLLLPVALAGLPPHHQQLVERFGAENVNFDKNVSSCHFLTHLRNYGIKRNQKLLKTFWSGANCLLRLLHGNHSWKQRRSPGASAKQVQVSFGNKNQVISIRYPNKEHQPNRFKSLLGTKIKSYLSDTQIKIISQTGFQLFWEQKSSHVH